MMGVTRHSLGVSGHVEVERYVAVAVVIVNLHSCLQYLCSKLVVPLLFWAFVGIVALGSAVVAGDVGFVNVVVIVTEMAMHREATTS
jgi:hypothetical protein